MPPPPPPPTYAVSQSTYTPSDNMVEALIEALSAQKWRMKTSLWPQQVRVCGTLHEDKLCKGVVLNIEQTGSGKSHTMRLSSSYEGAISIITVPLLAFTASIQTKMEESDPAHGPVTVIHLDEHCTDKQARAKVIAILNFSIVLRPT